MKISKTVLKSFETVLCGKRCTNELELKCNIYDEVLKRSHVNSSVCIRSKSRAGTVKVFMSRTGAPHGSHLFQSHAPLSGSEHHSQNDHTGSGACGWYC